MNSLVLKQDLLAAFRELGMQPGMTVMVHTSLSSMGYVCGGAPTGTCRLRRQMDREV